MTHLGFLTQFGYETRLLTIFDLFIKYVNLVALVVPNSIKSSCHKN